MNNLRNNSPEIDDKYFEEIKFEGEKVPYQYYDTPYISCFLKDVFNSLADYSFSLFGHPHSALFAISSTDKDPIKKLEKLSLLPSYFKDGIFTDDIPSYYVIVNDVSQEPAVDINTTLKSMKKKYGSSNCFVITINSLETPNMKQKDIWDKYRTNSMTDTKYNIAYN